MVEGIRQAFLSFDPFIFPQRGEILFYASLLFSLFIVTSTLKGSLFIKWFVKGLCAPSHLYGVYGFLFPFFLFLVRVNLRRLWPYFFPATAHLLLTWTFGLSFWRAAFCFQLVFSFKHKIKQLVPLYTPSGILPIMVVVELASQLVRPLTLRVRLTANLTAGHLLMTFIGDLARGPLRGILLALPLFLLEIVVSFVQPFVFCMLIIFFLTEK